MEYFKNMTVGSCMIEEEESSNNNIEVVEESEQLLETDEDRRI